MVHRRQVLAGLGPGALAANVASKLSAATPIKPDNQAALLIIDVQNCFLPGGSLAVRTAIRSSRSSTESQRAFSTW